jgi:hypothetical protein
MPIEDMRHARTLEQVPIPRERDMLWSRRPLLRAMPENNNEALSREDRL